MIHSWILYKLLFRNEPKLHFWHVLKLILIECHNDNDDSLLMVASKKQLHYAVLYLAKAWK